MRLIHGIYARCESLVIRCLWHRKWSTYIPYFIISELVPCYLRIISSNFPGIMWLISRFYKVKYCTQVYGIEIIYRCYEWYDIIYMIYHRYILASYLHAEVLLVFVLNVPHILNLITPVLLTPIPWSPYSAYATVYLGWVAGLMSPNRHRP